MDGQKLKIKNATDANQTPGLIDVAFHGHALQAESGISRPRGIQKKCVKGQHKGWNGSESSLHIKLPRFQHF